MTILVPDIFRSEKKITAFFTEANRREVNVNGTIPGLNLGYNTAAPKDEIDQNFHTLFNQLELNDQQIAIAEQVHGTSIQVVDKPGTISECDGLITAIPGLAVGIRVADCAAVLVADPVNRVAGAFHAGWKGAAGHIVSKGVEMMRAKGGDPAHFVVYCSPCISQKNFEVGEEVAGLFPDKHVDRKNYDKPHVDLPGYIRQQLTEKGVRQRNIEIGRGCTMQEERFFSYRREREQAGRMLAMIKINP